MANLLTRTKYVNFVIRKLSYPNDFENKLLEFCKAECDRYSYIAHENDINGYGEIESLHYHLVLVYHTAKRLSTHLNYLCDILGFNNNNGIEISQTKSEVLSIQYLLHKNNPEKTQHNISEITSSISTDELQTILDSESDNVVTYEYILNCIRENPTKLYLIHKLGINTYKNYRYVILDMLDEFKQGVRL